MDGWMNEGMRHRASWSKPPSSLACTPAVATSWSSCFYSGHIFPPVHRHLGSQRDGSFKGWCQAAAHNSELLLPCSWDETQRPHLPRPYMIWSRCVCQTSLPTHPSLCCSLCCSLLAVSRCLGAFAYTKIVCSPGMYFTMEVLFLQYLIYSSP